MSYREKGTELGINYCKNNILMDLSVKKFHVVAIRPHSNISIGAKRPGHPTALMNELRSPEDLIAI